MARPRSDEKRRAILDAALRVSAERGIANAPTSAISKAAGVAEGTLFTYFESKDDLMNALYLEMRQEFSRHLDEFPKDGDACARLRYIWERYLRLGVEQPGRLRVLAQLRSSGRLFKDNEPPARALVELVRAIGDAVKGTVLENAPLDYLALLFRSQAEITIEFISAHPEREKECTDLGFSIFWNGLKKE